MKKFEIPEYYKSSIIAKIKEMRNSEDRGKKDFTPTSLDFGVVEFLIPRHFGFCYGVEHAVNIAYKAIDENQGKRIFLLSEMIHNPSVNEDLLNRGVVFMMNTDGKQVVSWDELSPEDVVIIPAFGTTVEIEKELAARGIDPYRYNTTCPFVEKVWKRSGKLGNENFTTVIHGKHKHEETRATFSHTKENGSAVVVRDINETNILCDIIKGKIAKEEFYRLFDGKYSEGFDVEKNLVKIGVVNQTTMLASETEEISSALKEAMIETYGVDDINEHFADTRDTLCYATNDNQKATYGLREEDVDFALVVGGYNSSNTSHIVELLEEKFDTYFISSDEKIISSQEIRNYNLEDKKEVVSFGYIPKKGKVRIAVTCGASCPDAMMDRVIKKVLTYFPEAKVPELLNEKN